MKQLRVLMPAILLGGLSVAAQTGVTDSLLNIVRQNKRDKTEAIALNDLGFGYSRTDMKKSVAFLSQAETVSLEGEFFPQLSNAYDMLALDMQDMGRKDSALFFLDKLKLLVDAHPGVRGSYVHAAGMYYKHEQDFRSAQPFLIESVVLAEKDKKNDSITHLTNIAGAYLNLGNNVVMMGDYRGAQRYQLKALSLFEQVGNKKGISYCYQMLGNNFLQLNQLTLATDYTRRGLALKTEMNDTRGMATSLQQLGSIFRYRRLFDSALKYDQATLAMDQRLGLKQEEANLDLELGNVSRDKGDDSAAERYFMQGRALAQSTNDSSRLATFESALSSIRNRSENQVVEEQRLLNTAEKERRANDVINLQLSYQYLADYYANKGQTKKAFEWVKRFYSLSDSLSDLNTQVQLRKIEGQYNVEKKEKEIALLKKDQQLSRVNLEKQRAIVDAQTLALQKQRFFEYGAVVLVVLLLLIGFLVINRYRLMHRVRRAVELEKMRNHIARDLHDDIGSTLSSINILSRVVLETPATMRSNLEKIRDRSAAIMEKMDDIVWTISPQNDTMEQMLYRMQEFAAEMLEPLDINYTFEEDGNLSAMKIGLGKRRDLYLLFKEAVNNAAKYSQCRNLHILFRRQGDLLQMEITDDGKGFSEETVRSGNGLTNMRERAASMPARIRIDSKVGQGTSIGLELPMG